MTKRQAALLAAFAFGLICLARSDMIHVSAQPPPITLPNGWVIDPPPGAQVQTGTMPQGMTASPDGTTLAVVESGYNPPALSLYRVPSLDRVESIPLPGAFGRPLWTDDTHVLVPGANADALLVVDVRARTVRRIGFPKGSYPVYATVSPDGRTFAVATDGDGAIRIGSLESVGAAAAIPIGGHPGGVLFSSGGESVFATVRFPSDLVRIDTSSHAKTHVAVGLHPSALALDGTKLYVAQTDADAVAVYDTRDLRLLAMIPVGDNAPFHTIGVSPNAISVAGGSVFVSLGAANSIAVIQNDRVAGRVQAGWYPIDCVALGQRLYLLDGKGEGARPNPHYRPATKSDVDYIGAIEFGSVRAYDISSVASEGNPQGSSGWSRAGSSTIVSPQGPIKHVFFVLKENRSYDQVLGDMRAGNGDAALAWFGERVTPNEHAIAARFGLFDNAYTSGEVSAAGHMWADSAFANDYVERFWPSLYGNRGDTDDLSGGDGPRVPAGGYLWQEARRVHVTFRDYGETR